MDWRLLGSTFAVIFLAEMGDKTQLAAMTLAAESRRPWPVFLGASLALTLVSGLGVAFGAIAAHYVPLAWIKRGAGVLFLVIGTLILVESFRS
jgi:putative Ca2+/H+ antiporter (TMEM165/GDT1 family)